MYQNHDQNHVKNLLNIQTLETKSLCLGAGNLNFNKCHRWSFFTLKTKNKGISERNNLIDVEFELMDLQRVEKLDIIMVFKGPWWNMPGRRWGNLTPDPVLCSSLRVQERIASVLDATCKGAWRLVVGMSCIAAQEVIDVKWIDVHTRERSVILYLRLVKGSQGYPLKRERSLEQAEENMPICLQTSCQQKILGENENN